MRPVRICFVCLGNICRSPLAEAVLRHKAAERGLEDKVEVASRGTGSWHVGEPPDPRMEACAQAHGIDMPITAEQFSSGDYAGFDLILAMDGPRFEELRRGAPEDARHRVVPFRRYDPEGGEDEGVPDPYYGGDEGFERVFRIVERTCDVILDCVAAGTIVPDAR